MGERSQRDDPLSQALDHVGAGRLMEAEALLRKILAVQPNHQEALHALGLIAFQVGRHDAALELIGRASQAAPNNAIYANNLGTVQQKLGKKAAAEANFRRALAMDANYPDALYNLGNVLAEMEQLDAAIDLYQRTLRNNPNHAAAHYNLGNTLQDLGRIADAIASFDIAIQLNPAFVAAHSNRLLSMQYLDTAPADHVRRAAQQFADAIETPRKAAWPMHRNVRDPNKRLKVGYVSADFRRHSVGYYIEPLLANHDASQVETYCYYSHPQDDEMTRRMMQVANHWRPCHALNDDALVACIVDDGIDILVDLGGHTAHSRLAVFAQKPAPIQVAYLGYPATTGLTAMDYRLTDVIADPGEMDPSRYSETLHRLSRTFLCYRPPTEAPAVAPLPAIESGQVAFGSFNALPKLSPATIALWSRILRALPGSTLTLKSSGLAHASVRGRLIDDFARHGVKPSRVILLVRDADFMTHLARYAALDICLDPLGYNGTTTTCEALWMGVPTISLRGHQHAARVGASLLSSVGLNTLVCETENAYVDTALALANDLPRLAAMRNTMRARLETSPLLDGKGLADVIENAYRAIWTRWCNAQTEARA